MTAYSKYNIIYRLQKWLDSVPGQTFLNYAYSWGASIVILGTLFKLTHLPGANLMLYLGMGTEVVVFFISAFDRPFDKTAIGKDLPTHLEEEGEETTEAEQAEEEAGQSLAGGAVVQGGGTIVIGGGMGGARIPAATEGGGAVAAMADGTVLAGGSELPTWLQQQQQVTPEMEEALNAARKRNVGRPKKDAILRKNPNEGRATFIVDERMIRKVKYISLVEARLLKDIISEALSSYIEKWEEENEPIKLPKKK